MAIRHHGRKLWHRVISNSSQLHKGQTHSSNRFLVNVTNTTFVFHTENIAKRFYTDRTTTTTTTSPETEPLQSTHSSILKCWTGKSNEECSARDNKEELEPCVIEQTQETRNESNGNNKKTSSSSSSFGSRLLQLCSFHKPQEVKSNEHVAMIIPSSVKWVLHERLDFLVQYELPATWEVNERVCDNSLSIQCTPHMKRVRELQKLKEALRIERQQETNLNQQLKTNNIRPAIHGISINCFSYKHKVPNADHHKLLHLFLKRFAMSVNNSLEVIDMSSLTPNNLANEVSSEKKKKQTSLEVNEMLELESLPNELPNSSSSVSHTNKKSNKIEHHGLYKQQSQFPHKENICQWIASHLSCAVAEITFQPYLHSPIAHGYCRVFYNSNKRFHYTVIVAVPEDEFESTRDVIIHAIAAVTENKMNVTEEEQFVIVDVENEFSSFIIIPEIDMQQ